MEVLKYRVRSYVRRVKRIYVRTKYLCGNFLFSRKRTKIRKKTKYTILDNIDEQERMELRPKYGKSYLFLWDFFKKYIFKLNSSTKLTVSGFKLISTAQRSTEAGVVWG